MSRAVSVVGACVLTMWAVAAQAQETNATTTSGVSVGAQLGVVGGSSLWQPYDLVDGSGSHFGGLTIGYSHRFRSGVLFGGDGDLSFLAEPAADGVSGAEVPQQLGTVRARVGYGPQRWSIYGTGGLAWRRNQVIDADQFLQHTGWAIGAGFERAIDARWRANAEYLYSRAGVATSEVRVGVRYMLPSEPPTSSIASSASAAGADQWNIHGQTTMVAQYSAPFHAPYRGPNSLDPNIARETWDVTFYVGRRLWNGAAAWINPEIDQGYGLSNTLGVAGFTSGEAYKVGYTHPYIRVPRFLVQQTINLGGAPESVEAGLNQFRGTRTANKLVATIGKFSLSDVFDTNGYAHDPRTDFMNWSLVDAATFDYAADAWGFTYGAALEWYQNRWVARAGVFDLSLVPNSADIDTSFEQYQVVSEIEHQHTMNGQPGKIAVAGFLSRGRMASYDEVLAVSRRTGAPATTADERRFNSRPGVHVNVAQQITPDVRVFSRVGWADGSVEPYEFTDIDRTASGGVSIAGSRWSRSDDILGIAAVFNDISSSHRAYFDAGGLGILAGDGRLPHPGIESIVETYYRIPVGPWQVTADYQFIVHPAFNRDRGPVSVVSLRLRAQF